MDPKLTRLLALLKEPPKPAGVRVENHADTSSAMVYLYDEIGFWGVSAADFAEQLAMIDAPTIELHLNSGGGEIFDGIAIANMLRQHAATVNVTVDGIAASIASIIAMAGDTVSMAPGSQLMIHDGSGMCYGDAADMTEMAALLDRQSDNLASIYADRAGGTPADWRGRMRAETWYTADEAVDAGLADKVLPRGKAAEVEQQPGNSLALSAFGWRYPDREHAPAPVPVLANTAVTVEVEAAAETEASVEEAAADDPTAQVTEPTATAPHAPAAAVDDEPTAPVDPWAALTKNLLQPPVSTTSADVLRAFREAHQ